MMKKRNVIGMRNFDVMFTVNGNGGHVDYSDEDEDVVDDGEAKESIEGDKEDLLLNPFVEDVHEWILEYVDSLCDIELIKERNNFIQFTSPVGLGRLAITGICIGSLFTFHFTLLIFILLSIVKLSLRTSRILCTWSLFIIILCIYHSAEFFTTARYNPSRTSYDSFLINQSKSYVIALIFAIAEFWIEAWLFPDSIIGLGAHEENGNEDGNHLFSFIYPFQLLALIIIAVGQTFRTLAMIHGGPSFTHMVQYRKREEHKLIKSGIFRYFRHPSYFGWFYWSISTQILLINPISTIAYMAAGWMFFKRRIKKEEKLLIDFFGEEYIDYKQSTIVGIPFIC